MPAIEDLTLEIDGQRNRCLWRDGVGTPTLYVHGNPTSSEEWVPFLQRHRGGPAFAIDLPGWGRSRLPEGGGLAPTMQGLSDYVDRCLDQLRIERHNLVVHDWGAVALIGAQAHPERVRRLVVIDAVPLLPSFRWHWVGRIWRRRPWGEIANATTTKLSMALVLRRARGNRRPMPREFLEMIWRHWPRGTNPAVLRLYRDGDPDRLAAAGAALDRIACPSLVVWGDRDPYLPTRFAHEYGRALGGAEVEILSGAGHWPWIDDPSLVERVLDFLD